MRSESIVSLLRQTESLRLDPMIVLTSTYHDVPGRDECRLIARGNRRSAVEGARATDLTAIACLLDESHNSFPSCRCFAGKLSALTPLEQQCNYVAKDEVLEMAYAAG